MSPLDAVAVAAAGFVAGGINAVVGSGSLLTFPVLLAVGYGPVTANVSNTLGLVFGNVSSVHGYRAELAGQRRLAVLLVVASAVGSAIGATLLLALPGDVFEAVVPVLILLAVALMAVRPSPRLTEAPETAARKVALCAVAVFTGVYGGYFGAAAGVILLASLRFLIAERLQRLNGLKNLAVATSNFVAAAIFVAFADVSFAAAALIAAGSIVGAQVGSTYGRRIPDEALRWLVVAVGTIVAAILIVT